MILTLFLTLLTFKLFGIVDWSWVIILAPLYITFFHSVSKELYKNIKK